MDEQRLKMDSTVRQNDRTAARRVGEKTLVVVIDTNHLHKLNQTGGRVWDLCDGRTVGEVAECLAEEYALPMSDAERDVRAFVHALHGAGAVILEERAVVDG